MVNQDIKVLEKSETGNNYAKNNYVLTKEPKSNFFANVCTVLAILAVPTIAISLLMIVGK